jgi:hypothetical protein
MSSRPLSTSMQKALVAMLKGPLRRSFQAGAGDGWIATDNSFHAPLVVRGLSTRGLISPPMKLAVLSIAGRKMAQRLASEATIETATFRSEEKPRGMTPQQRGTQC